MVAMQADIPPAKYATNIAIIKIIASSVLGSNWMQPKSGASLLAMLDTY